MKKYLVIAVLLIGSGSSYAKGEKKVSPVSVNSISYQQIIKKDKKGKLVKKWVKVTKVVPKDVVKYINTVTNNTKEAITSVKVNNNINENLTYVAKSARCEGKCTVRFSIDGGKSYKLAKNLYVVKNKKKRLALPKEYNSIEWTIDTVDADSATKVEFKAQVK